MNQENLIDEIEQLKKELDRIEARSMETHDTEENVINKIVNVIPHEIIFINNEFTVEWANKIALDNKGNIIGKPCYKAMYDRADICENCPCVKVLETGLENSAVLRHSSDDQERYISVTGIPIRENDGDLMGLVEISRDVTIMIEQDKKAKQQFEVLNKERDELFRKVGQKSQFISRFSNELKVPLNGIMGMVKLLDDAALTEIQKEYLYVLRLSTERMMQSINHLLSNEKIETKSLEIVKNDFNIIKMFKRINEVYSISAKEKNLDLDIQISKSIPSILKGDQKHLYQAISNIVENAINYTEHGEIIIKVEDITHIEDKVNIKIQIKDTGIGILEDDLKYVSDAYYQVDNLHNRSLLGAGLGLTISKEIIGMMDGEIRIISSLGKGTTVDVFITLDKLIVQPKSNILPKEGRQDQLKILIADHEMIDRVTLKVILKDHYEVAFARTGKELVELYFEWEPDLVITSILLEELNGFEAFDEIEKRRFHKVPIIATSKKVIETEKVYLISYGFDEYLEKPYNGEAVLEIVNRTIRRNSF